MKAMDRGQYGYSKDNRKAKQKEIGVHHFLESCGHLGHCNTHRYSPPTSIKLLGRLKGSGEGTPGHSPVSVLKTQMKFIIRHTRSRGDHM
jgi:hypothetical protein